MVCRVGKRRLVTLSQGVGAPSLATIDRGGALGDSIVRQMHYEWGSSVSRWNLNAFSWAGRAAYLSARKFWVDPAAVEGYSGYRTDQILAAMLDASATTSFGPGSNKITIPYGVRAVRPKYCFEMSGTNDVTYYTGGDPSTAVGYRRQIWAALRAAGVEPIALSLLPRGDAYNSAVPTWNAAFAAAAAIDGVQWIDIWTTCQSGGAWKTGYNWKNGAVDPVSGLHPGADGCGAIGAAIAAAITAKRTEAPTLVTGSSAEIRRAGRAVSLPVASTGWDGLMSSAGNWPARYEPLYASTRSVGADALAQVGQALSIACAPQATEFYSDTVSPLLTVTSGARYAVFGRFEFTAGVSRPTPSDVPDTAGIGVYDAAYNPLFSISTGGSMAYSVDGASLPAGDWYGEFSIPAGITQVRLFWEQRTQPASAGSTFKVAQAGIIGPL